MSIKLRIRNTKQLITLLEYDKKLCEQVTADIVKYHAGQLVNLAKKYCPVDTGQLRSSIRDTTVEDGGNNFNRYVSANTNYARYVEYGTTRTRPQPYMIPASYEIENQLHKAIKKAIVKQFK